MFSFIRGFTDFEKDCFWQISEPPNMTVCRIALRIINNGRVQSIEACAINDLNHHTHAERIAIEEVLWKAERYYTYLTGHTELDMSIILNNSSCGECQEFILDRILELEKIIGGKLVNLHLFFSHLYMGTHATTKEAIDTYSNWIIRLVGYGVIVRIYPILVVRMIDRRGDLTGWELCNSSFWDAKLIDHFIELFSRICYTTSYKSFLNFRYFNELFLIQSWDNLRYICISRS